MITCSKCAYCLDGVPLQAGGWVHCPECGERQLPQEFRPQQWPSPVVFVWRSSWTTVLLCTLCAALLLLCALPYVSGLIALLLMMAMFASLVSGFVRPLIYAKSLAARVAADGPLRRRAARRALWLGLMVNLFVGAGFMVIGLAIIGTVIAPMMPD